MVSCRRSVASNIFGNLFLLIIGLPSSLLDLVRNIIIDNNDDNGSDGDDDDDDGGGGE